MAVPEPNSPEARRAAQKVRNVFYMIAAANFVIIAIVMWPRPKLPPRETAAAAAATDPVVAEMEAVFGRLLAGYNGRDAERFGAEFASTADPKPDEEYFRTVIIEKYADQFGELTSPTRSSESGATLDGGILTSELASKKAGRVKSRATFVRDGGKLRVVTWKLEKM